MGKDQCTVVGFGISSTGLMGCRVYVFNYFVKANEKWRNKKFYNSSDNISDYMTTGYSIIYEISFSMINCELHTLHAMKWEVLVNGELERKRTVVTCF